MKKTALLVAVCYLQGCVTPKVLDLANKGIDKSGIPLTAKVESAWRDPISQEYVICIKDPAFYLDKKRNRFTLKIPENLIGDGESGLIEFSKWAVSEPKPKDEQHWWSGEYKERDSVQVYGLTLPVEYGCSTPGPQWAKLQLLKAPAEIDTNDAMLFRGEKLRQIIAKKQPFAIFSSSTSDHTAIDPDLAIAPQRSVCNKATNGTCLQLVAKPQDSYSEILIPDQLIWSYKPETAWYWVVPFAVIADAVIVAGAIFLLGAGGAGAGR
jgi:hypothetical protein